MTAGSEDDAAGEDGDEGTTGRALRIEVKTFAWFLADDYFRIKEYHRKGFREICFSTNIAHWVCAVLKEKCRAFGRNRAKVSRQFEGITVSAIEGSNRWGSFLSIQVKKRSAESNFIIIPAGFQGCNWESFALWLENGISSVLENSVEVIENSSFSVGKHCSYADALKSSLREIDSNCRWGFVEENLNPINQPDVPIVSLEREIQDLRMQLHRLSDELSQFRLSNSISCSSLEVNGNDQAIVVEPFAEEIYDFSSLVVEPRSDPLSFEELCGSPMALSPSENNIRNMLLDNLGFSEKGIVNNPGLGGAVEEINSRYSRLATEVSTADEVQPVSKERSAGCHFGEDKGSDIFEFQNSKLSSNGKEDDSLIVADGGVVDYHVRDHYVDTSWGSDKIFDVGQDKTFSLKEMLKEVESSMDFDNLPYGIGRTVLIEGEYFDGATIFESLKPPERARVSKIAFKLWRRNVGRPLLKKLCHYGVEVRLDLYEKAQT